MKLFDLEMGVYCRRVTIYLAEKGIVDIELAVFDPMGWPSPDLPQLTPMRTVPVLETDSGLRIRTSLAIMEYLEEVYPTPNMLGATPEQRARTRELTSVIDEATLSLGSWGHHGSPIFVGRAAQSREAGIAAADDYVRKLHLLDMLFGETSGPFVAGGCVTIADCVLMALLEFAQNVYDVPVPQACERVIRWQRAFAERPSAAPPSYPAPLLQMTQGLVGHCPPSSLAM